jgi:hypothetical protein
MVFGGGKEHGLDTLKIAIIAKGCEAMQQGVGRAGWTYFLELFCVYINQF